MTAPGRPPARVETATGWYVYGVAPTAEASEQHVHGVRGVAGKGVSLVDAGAVVAIASKVPLAEFGDEPIADNLRDPAWLERRVRAHEEVLEAVLGSVPVVPFRFATIYRSEEHLRAALGEDGRFEQLLEQIRGKVELGVKGFLSPMARAAEETGAGTDVTSGRRYLEEKQSARRRAEEHDALKAELAHESHERLAAVAHDAVANAPQPSEVSGRDAEMFLNGAYLVSRDEEERFRGALQELERKFAATGAAYELTGPWPPYNFVESAT